MSFSGAILYWLATSLCTALSSSRNIFIRINGSRPFCVSMCQGFGRASKSETEPCDRPSTDSPNSLWDIEYCDSCSFTYKKKIKNDIADKSINFDLKFNKTLYLCALEYVYNLAIKITDKFH